MIKGKTEEEIKNILILNKYLQNKHIVLIYIKDKNEMGDFPTVLDIKEAFSIKQKYAYTLLKYLERDRLIRKYDKIHNNGYKYATFKVTRKAYAVFESGRKYRVYFTPRRKVLVNIEALD